ncbi:LPXTG-site transpeptidase (sortase) family protein [Dietzia sp. 2505]|uniref:class F sortase n=1 Tax=Dietzia sp. 2505 TaxID=3156457 RepID=UPI003395A9A8
MTHAVTRGLTGPEPVESTDGRRRRPRALLGLALTASLAASCATGASGVGQEQSPSTTSQPSAVARAGTSAEAGDQVFRASPAEPVELRIPSIGLQEAVIDLAIQDDGTLEAPDDWDDVGWFADGPRPGERGPTVFAGHVDSASGPAVFFRVLELASGDVVEVSAADGAVHRYRVDRVEDHPKDEFPTREVFGLAAEDELRLITCTGEFDGTDRRYLDNRVVFASAVA